MVAGGDRLGGNGRLRGGQKDVVEMERMEGMKLVRLLSPCGKIYTLRGPRKVVVLCVWS